MLSGPADPQSTQPVTPSWYMGSFSQPGIGGLDSGVTPSRGCTGTNAEAQLQGSISYEQRGTGRLHDTGRKG